MTEEEQARHRARFAVDALNKAFTVLRESVERLPQLPDDGWCGCGSSDWLLQGEGYTRFTRLTRLELEGGGGWAAFGNGWSDFTDDGEADWVICNE